MLVNYVRFERNVNVLTYFRQVMVQIDKHLIISNQSN